MNQNFLKGVVFALLSASVWGQNPTDFDYEEDVPSQPGARNVPVFVNVHTHPKTGFSCADKQAGQYYADPETKCAVYYVCIANERGGLSAQSFACPNGTLFSQSTRVCASHENVYCPISERYYDAIHGTIDSKGQEELHKPAALQPWRKPQSRPVAQPQPRPQSQPAPQPQPAPSSRTQPILRSQPQARPQPTRIVLPSAPDSSSSSAQNSRRNPFTPTTTTTTTTAAPVEYEYEYVDYPLPNDTIQGRSPVQPPVRSKRETSAPIRRKGQLPSPFDFLSAPHIITSFNCEDKVPGIAYADTQTDCRMFHVCIPFSKGKLKDYQLYCETNKTFNQETGVCEPQDKVSCGRSHKFYVYNKWFRPQDSRKDSWKHIKRTAKKT